MECPNCGAENPVNAPFCGLCLTKFEPAPSVAPGVSAPGVGGPGATAQNTLSPAVAVTTARRVLPELTELVLSCRHDQALPMAERLVAQLEAANVVTGAYYWQALDQAATCAEMLNQTDAAIEYQARMLSTMEGHPEARADFISALRNQAALLTISGDVDTALALREQALQMTSATGNNPRLIAEELLEMAMTLCEAARYDEADLRLAEGVQIIQTVIGDPSSAMADAYSIRGQILFARGMAEEGIGWLREALHMDRSLPKRDMGSYLMHLSRVAARAGDEEYESAMREIRAVPGTSVDVGERDASGVRKISITYHHVSRR